MKDRNRRNNQLIGHYSNFHNQMKFHIARMEAPEAA